MSVTPDKNLTTETRPLAKLAPRQFRYVPQVEGDAAPVEGNVTRAGWFNFEGFGRPWEGWVQTESGGSRSTGRAFTIAGARRKAIKGELGRRFP